ncbi:MAG: GTP-sensing pleiotropic transcriptional regulator CodY [Firmicutes bacterium]|nr:GTP-sensing pleiotropic transcriptional regulator CodY [Bacillota bacterium]
MKEDLLSRIRRLNKVLTESTTGIVSFDEMCELMYDMLDCNIYIFNRRGKLLAGRFDKGEEKPIIIDEESGNAYLPETYNDRVLTFSETHENLTYDSIREVFGEDYDMAAKFHTFIPVLFGGKRVATVLLARASKAFSDEDIAIAEYGATVVGIEVARGIAQEEEELDRQKAIVENAVETLSYSELEAVGKIFRELEGDEGLLVASKIADKSGITRSVIVNALRKLESAGVIESRSLGMKGTRIRIINEFLRETIEKN